MSSKNKQSKHVIIISVDALRFDAISAETDRTYLIPHGLEQIPQTPRIDRFAREGFMFSGCRSTATLTPPSHAAMLTGIYQNRNGVRHLLGDTLRSNIPNYFEIFAAHGFTPVAATDVPHLFLLTELFRGAEEKTFCEHAIEQIVSIHRSGGRAAAFLHLNDVHAPYGFEGEKRFQSNPEMTRFYSKMAREWGIKTGGKHPLEAIEGKLLESPFSQNLALAIYLMGVNRFDRGRFTRIMRRLSQAGVLKDSLVIITGDHGESWIPPQFQWSDKSNPVPYDYFGHGVGVSETLLRVPLIFWGKGIQSRGGKTDIPVSMVDLLPTLLGFMGLDEASGMDGVDRSELLRSTQGLRKTADALRPSACYAENFDEPESMVRRMIQFWRFAENDAKNVKIQTAEQAFGRQRLDQRTVRMGSLKWVERTDREPLLYDLARDPFETSNILNFEILQKTNYQSLKLGAISAPRINRKSFERLFPRLSRYQKQRVPQGPRSAAEIQRLTEQLGELGYIDI
jgi:arylsulfatase A-like enzyme